MNASRQLKSVTEFPDVIQRDHEIQIAVEEAIAALPYGSQDPDVERVCAEVKAKIRAARELKQSSES